MKKNTKIIAGTGLLTAIVVVLQLFGSAIKFGPFSISLVLLPIVVGAALYGKWSGAWLGLAFGVTVLLSGDAAAFLTVNPIGTVLTVLLKGMLAGLCAGLIYSLVEKKNKTLAAFCAAFVSPVVNTGMFLIGCLIFFMPTINEWAAGAGFESAGKFMIFGLVGANFLFELGLNIVFVPVIVKLVSLGRKENR